MKIALIGSKYSISEIRRMLNPEMSFVEIVEFPCGWEEIVPLLEEIQRSFDGILFTGIRYFLHASRYGEARIPWSYPKRSTNALLCSLIKAQLSDIDISKITYDLYDMPTSRLVEQLCKSGLPADKVSVYRYTASDSGEGYSDSASAYHLDNLKDGRANLCLSGSFSVVKHPRLKGFPTLLVPMTEEDVNNALNELRIQHQNRVHQGRSGFIPAVVSLSVQLKEVLDGGGQAYRQLRSTHQVEVEVFAFAQSIGAALETHSRTDFLLYTTKAELYAATDYLVKFDLAHHLQYFPEVQGVFVGIGLGHTYSIAKSNVQSCSQNARGQKYNCYYVKDGDGVPSGPFILKQSNAEREIADIQVERIARETGVAAVILNAIIIAKAQFGFQTVTSDKLAEMCGLTVNNMNRVISKLDQKGYVEMVGKQPNNGAGRPKRLFRLKLGPTL